MSDCESEFGESRRESMYDIEAIVVSITKDHWIVAQENVDPRKEKLYRLDRQSFNMSHKAIFPRIREYIKIRDLRQTSDAESFLPPLLVTKFEYTPSQDREYIKEEIMAVAKVTPHYITLVGKSFPSDVQVCIPCDPNDFSVGQLVSGCIVELPVFVDIYRPKMVDRQDLIQYRFNYQVEREAQRREIECPQPLLYPELIRPLTDEEEQLIFTRCESMPQIDLHHAQRFIQEPLIAAGLLEKYTQYQEVLKFLISIRHQELGVDEKGYGFLSFFIDFNQYTHLFTTQSLVTWRVGGEVQVVHKQLRLEGKEKEAHMVIRRATPGRTGYQIDLCATNRSRELLKAAFGYRRAFEHDFFHISPIFDNKDATVEAVRTNFDEFFLSRRHMFDLCIGRVPKPEEVEIKDREKPFYVNGKPLDASQLDFMRSAAAIPGFTCAQAPPGCGKTHTTSALVSLLKHMRVKGGICISGTTNAAVTNAADAVASRFPDIRITREYSLKAEGDITEISQKASLKHMASDAGKYLDLNSHESLRDEIKKMKNAQDQLNERAPNLRQHLSRVQNAAKMERNVKKSFVQAYNLHVYATTVELLIRRGDIFRGSEVEEDKSVRRLILDEAAQMSPVEAMALYCSFPHLEYITLLGDMKQLGPHSSIPQGSACYKLICEGELTRMYKFPSTTKRELNTIYRCHPAITEKFLIPIYGPQMKSGVSAASRSLAKDHGLMVAEDESPCVLIDVEGVEEKGRNYMEKRTALDLIYDIVDVQGVMPEDVVVICNHRAQMNSLIEDLKDQGVFGPLKTKVAVHTVDSFQGKEAKVIILLTTKTCNLHDPGDHKMKFVGDAARGTVAVSRAQHALYILGHWQSLAKTEFWAQFLRNMIVAGGIVNRHFGETDIIPKLRTLIKFSIQETVEEVKVEVIEPQQVDVDCENSDSDYSDEEDSADPAADLNLINLSITDPPQPAEVPVGDLISFD